MRRLEEALHDLAEQDQRLETRDLITRIEQHLSGERSTSVVALPGRPTMDTLEKTHPTERRRNWVPLLAAGGAALLLLLAIGLPILYFRGGDSTVVDESTTVPPTSTTVTPTTVAPMVDAWQRVGHEVMNPVPGLFDMTATESRLLAVGFDPGEDQRQNGVIFTSDDGVTWNRLAEDDPALTLGAVLMYGATEGGPGLVVVGMGCENNDEPCPAHPTVWTSVDGTSWTRSAADADVFGESGAMLDVITTESGIIAAGSVGEVGADDAYRSRPAVWSSPDGVEWERVWEGDPIDAEGFIPGFHALAAGSDGRIVGVGTAENDTGDAVAAAWLSTDGHTWERTDPDSAAFTTGTVGLDVTWGTAGFIAVGTEDGVRPVIWQSPDASTWTLVDTADQPFDTVGTLAAVAPLDTGYVAAGPHGFADQLGGWVTLWTSPDGLTWDRVHTIGSGYAIAVVATDAGIAVAGGMPGADDFHAAVWAGPVFDPAAPPPDPRPPAPSGEEGEDEDEDFYPEFDPTVEAADVAPGIDIQPRSDDYVVVASTGRLPLGERSELPSSPNLDFLTSICADGICFRDANVIDPDDDQMGAGSWLADVPFHIRHGFVNEGEAALGSDFDVVVFVTRRDGPDLGDGVFEINQTYRFDSDYVLRATTGKCGPDYWDQTGPQTCEWFVHDFAEGLPAGRYDLWAEWYAPCSAWLDLGLADACENSSEVSSRFAGSVNMPLIGEDYDDGMEVVDPDTFFEVEAGPVMRGVPAE